MRPVDEKRRALNETEERLRDMRLSIRADEREIEEAEARVAELGRAGRKTQAMREVEGVRLLREARDAKQRNLTLLSKNLNSYRSALGIVETQQTIARLNDQKVALVADIDLAGLGLCSERAEGVDMELSDMLRQTLGATEEEAARDQASDSALYEELMREAGNTNASTTSTSVTTAPLATKKTTAPSKYSHLDVLLDF